MSLTMCVFKKNVSVTTCATAGNRAVISLCTFLNNYSLFIGQIFLTPIRIISNTQKKKLTFIMTKMIERRKTNKIKNIHFESSYISTPTILRLHISGLFQTDNRQYIISTFNCLKLKLVLLYRVLQIWHELEKRSYTFWSDLSWKWHQTHIFLQIHM